MRGSLLANQELPSLGITSIQDTSARNDIPRWNMFRRWQERGLLKLRVTMMMGCGMLQGVPRNTISCPQRIKNNFASGE